MKKAYVIFQFVLTIEAFRNTFYIRQYLNRIIENYLHITLSYLHYENS